MIHAIIILACCCLGLLVAWRWNVHRLRIARAAVACDQADLKPSRRPQQEEAAVGP